MKNAPAINWLVLGMFYIVFMQTFTFAAHPGLFFNSSSLPALQAKVQSGLSKTAYDALLTGTPQLNSGLLDGSVGAGGWASELIEVSLKYAISGNTTYADRAMSGLNAMLNLIDPSAWDPQNVPYADWYVNWIAADMGWAMVVAYDILYDYMSSSKRAQVLAWLEDMCHWYYNTLEEFNFEVHNHQSPAMASLAMTAWAIKDETSDNLIKTTYSTKGNQWVRKWYDMYFQPDGDVVEGNNYTTFGSMQCFLYAAARIINNDSDIIRDKGAYNINTYMGYGARAHKFNGNPTFPSMGDDDLNEHASQGKVPWEPISRQRFSVIPLWDSMDPVQHFFWKHCQPGVRTGTDSTNIYATRLRETVFVVLFYPENLGIQHPHDAGLPDSHYFKDDSGLGGSVGLRSGWDLAGNGENTITSWYIARYNRENHSHHDMSSFDLCAYGEEFLVDHQCETYSPGNHGTLKEHNLIVVDDQHLPSSQSKTGGCFADSHMYCELHGFTSADGGTIFRGDSKYSYVDRHPIADALGYTHIHKVTKADIDNNGGPYDKAERLFALINGGNNPSYIIAVDDIKKDSSSHKYDFRLHTKKTISGTGTKSNPFMLNGSSADLYITFIQPESFTASHGIYSGPVESHNMLNAVQNRVNGRFFTVLYPRKNGMPAQTITSSSISGGVGGTVSWGSAGTDYLLEKRSGNQVSYNNVVSEGRFANVRVESGSAVSCLLLEGETLSYNGTTLISISGGGSGSSSLNGTIASVDAPGTTGFSMYAPAATTMLLNGSKISLTRNGDYVVFGDGGPKPPAPKLPADGLVSMFDGKTINCHISSDCQIM